MVHIHVFICSKSSSKNDFLFFLCKFLIRMIQHIILLIIYRIVRLITFLPCCRIFSRDDRLILCAKLEMLVFNDSCVRYFVFRIIYNCISLIIRLIQYFRFKRNTAVLQFSELVSIICIDRAGIYYFLCKCIHCVPSNPHQVLLLPSQASSRS